MPQNSYPTAFGNTGSLVDFTANLEVMFSKGYGLFEDEQDSAKMFYITRDVGGGKGKNFRVEEPLTAMQNGRETDEGDNYNVNTIAPGYYKDVTVRRRTASVQFTWDFDYHNKYPDVTLGLYRDIGYSLRRRIELDATHPFTFGTATTYTNLDGRSVDISTGDGNPLFHTAHTLTGSTTTFRNRLANNPQISTGAVEAMITLSNQNVLDNNGNRRPCMLDTIVVGSDEQNKNVALKIVNSLSPIDAPNANVFNPLRRRFRIVQPMFLDSNNVGNVDTTKSKYWMMVDMSHLGAYLFVTEQPNVVTPTVSNGGIVFANDNRLVKGAATYEFVVLDPRAYFFSSGDGTA